MEVKTLDILHFFDKIGDKEESKMIRRPLYLDNLISYIDKPFIKVLAGIRRAGKSSLLRQVYDELISRGVPEKKIALINFDTLEYTEIRDKAAFIELEKALLNKGVHYFLFDEVQNIDGWDEAISALYAEEDTDIFITGSNSKLLSSELSTFFTGRYVDFKIFTLNFAETIEFKKTLGQPVADTDVEFESYMRRGGFPSLYVSEQTEAQDDTEVTDIYNSILYRDLIERKNIRNTELLGRVTRFVFDNIGSPISAKSISDYLKNEHLALSQETVYNYLNLLEEALVIERVNRYDLRGKEVLKTQEKYYLSDIGLLYAINGRDESYISGVLENIVYHELVSHGYKVAIGKNGDKEIDFIAEKNHKKIYLQVAAQIYDRNTFAREIGAYEGIDDNWPKYILTLDHRVDRDENGVKVRGIAEFLLGME